MSAVGERWMYPDANTQPCIFDINMNAVDPDVAGWIGVSRRVLSGGPIGSGYGLLTISREGAFEHHPTSRVSVKGIDRLHLRAAQDIPLWMRERIAILNMAEAGMYIPRIGKRWSIQDHARSGNWNGTNMPGDMRYYTLEWNPEKETS